MYICRLFHRNRPTDQIDARLIASGALTLGRDPANDWPLEDAEGLLSRVHCTLSIEDGALLLRDSSTNGTFVNGGERAARGEAVPLSVSQVVRLGALMLRIERPAEVANVDATTIPLPSATPAADWDDPVVSARAPHPDASLLEAFCQGARLDASTFSDEDPGELMRRLGGIYQQAVLGLAALMAQRAAMKQSHDLDLTTVAAEDNNPLKWTAPRRLAQDLLRGHRDGFLRGDEAVRASFVELADHLDGVAAGASAVMAAALNTLDPDALAASTSASGFSLRGKAAVQLDLIRTRHERLRATGAIDEFKNAYQRRASTS